MNLVLESDQSRFTITDDEITKETLVYDHVFRDWDWKETVITDAEWTLLKEIVRLHED